MRQKTLLMRFISDRLKALPGDPDRKGKPKGEIIGPSRKKSAAALLFLMNHLPYKEIAEISGAKVTSVAIWHGRDDFKKLIARYADEFLEVLKTHFLAAVKKAHSGIAVTGNDFPEFADRHTYSSEILKALYEWAMEHPDINVRQDVLPFFGSNKAVIQLLSATIPEQIADCFDILNKPRISASDKQRINELLTLVSEYIKITGG